MHTEAITLDQAKAFDLFKAYQRDRHFETALDREIRNTYRQIAKGRTVIKAIESVAKAGVNERGLPKLALSRADHQWCYLRCTNTNIRMSFNEQAVYGGGRAEAFNWRPGDFVGSIDTRWHSDPHRALIPLIPLHLRPRTALSAYHILWEAEWEPIVPKDPLLLRRLGQGDLWVVCAAWDLTEVERAALQARVSFN